MVRMGIAGEAGQRFAPLPVQIGDVGVVQKRQRRHACPHFQHDRSSLLVYLPVPSFDLSASYVRILHTLERSLGGSLWD